MKVEFIKAHKGDCIWLTWMHNGVPESLLIDTGIYSTYEDILRLSQKYGKLSAIILTHVDYDHVGGIFNMLNDPKPPLKDDFVLFANTADLILTKDQSEKVNFSHGIKLDELLAKANFTCRPLYIDKSSLPTINFKGLTLTLLSPTKKILDLFATQSNAEKIKENYEKETNAISEKVHKKDLDENIKISDFFDKKESFSNPEKDLINSASIAFIAEADDTSWLMLADSNPLLIEEQLMLAEKSIENKLKVDYVKISHHGCLHNTSIALLKLVECSKYVISTNGSGPYYHPDKETIAKLIQNSSRDKEGYIEIYLNYPLTRQLLTAEEMDLYKVRIIAKNEF